MSFPTTYRSELSAQQKENRRLQVEMRMKMNKKEKEEKQENDANETKQITRCMAVEAFIDRVVREMKNDGDNQQIQQQQHPNKSMIETSEVPVEVYGTVYMFYGRIEGYQVVGIGDNAYGHLGIKSAIDTLYRATPLNQLSSIISDPSDIYVGDSRLMVKDMDNHLYCAGNNRTGECGCNSKKISITSFTGIKCNPNENVMTVDDIQIVGGGVASRHTVIVTKNEQNEQSLYSFGCNKYGQLCLGMRPCPIKYVQPVPLNVMNEFGGRIITQIGVGYGHTLFRCSDGSVFGCGFNWWSQIGFPSSDLIRSIIPIRIPFQSTSTETCSSSSSPIIIKTIAVGEYHNLCADINGNIYGFGRNSQQLGFGSALKEIYTITHPTLHPFFNNSNVNYHQIECGPHHTAVIDGNGNAFLFGCNNSGQIGNGHHGRGQKVSDPFMISIKNKKWKQISLGMDHTLLLTEDKSGNEVYACGLNKQKCRLCFSFDNGYYCDTPVLCSRENMGIADTETEKYGKVVRVIAMRENSIIVAEKVF